MAKTFLRWVTESFKLFDTDVSLKLRALDKREAPEFKRAVKAHFDGIGKMADETDEQHEARNDARLRSFNALCQDSFERYVRLTEPLEDAEKPGDLIETGAQLCAIAPSDFRHGVMFRLAALAALGDTEGKISGSPSTSTVEAGLPTTASPASITADTVSPTPSTATDAIPSESFSLAV